MRIDTVLHVSWFYGCLVNRWIITCHMQTSNSKRHWTKTTHNGLLTIVRLPIVPTHYCELWRSRSMRICRSWVSLSVIDGYVFLHSKTKMWPRAEQHATSGSAAVSAVWQVHRSLYSCIILSFFMQSEVKWIRFNERLSCCKPSVFKNWLQTYCCFLRKLFKSWWVHQVGSFTPVIGAQIQDSKWTDPKKIYYYNTTWSWCR